MSALAQDPTTTSSEPTTMTGTPTPAPAAGDVPRGDWGQQVRLGGLRRFAFAITVLNLLGHFYLGFETSWAHPLAALATAYGLELLLEWVDARAKRRVPRFMGVGFRGFVDFLLSAHITALAVSMLIYPNQNLWPVVFATSVAIGSKVVLRAKVGGRERHIMNPSNLGIAATLVLFPWVGIAPPYQFTESFLGAGNWLLPALIICTGTMINFKFTSRLPLLYAWLAGFAVQALLRHWLFGVALGPALGPMTGVAFVLFTFYMITDPATTPGAPKAQLVFGFGVAATYGVLMSLHVVFGLFFSLVIVCGIRGSWLTFNQLVLEAPAFETTAAEQRAA